MRVIGRTKPKGAMKVKGGCPFRAPSGADPRPHSRPPGPPYQSEAMPKGLRGVRPSPSRFSSGLVGTRCARWSGLGRLYAGGRRPGTCHSTPSRKSVVGHSGFAWALGWRAAFTGGRGRGFRLSPRLFGRGFSFRSCSVRGGLARVLSASTMSRHVGTRKMVNYAWPG